MIKPRFSAGLWGVGLWFVMISVLLVFGGIPATLILLVDD